MFRFCARYPAARLLLILPALAAGANCGGNDTGEVLTIPNSVVVADLTGNGLLDVAVAEAQIDQTGLTQKPGILSTIMNTPGSPGNFQAAVPYIASPDPPSALAVGDLTGTGSHDFVVASNAGGSLAVFMETSPTSGVYNAATTINVGGQPNDVQIADINGDGLPDLIVADNLGNVTYLLQNSAKPGTFLPGVSLPISNPSITAENETTRAIKVAVGDLNGDGLPDLAVTSFDDGGDYGEIFIFFQDANNPGTFLPTPLVIPAPGEPSGIVIKDVNQDGFPDIEVALQGLGNNSTTVTDEANEGAMIILQNSGFPGTFATPAIYPATYGVLRLAVADLNDDGLPDIAMCSLYEQGEGTIATLMQDPANPGQFLAPSTYIAQGQPASIVIGDLNNDGLPDLITADATSVVWYTNTPASPGAFSLVGQIGVPADE
jgi:FG-GAP-like repeat